MKFSLNFRLIVRIYGFIIAIIAAAMIPAMITAFVYKEDYIFKAFLASAVFLFAASFLCFRFARPKRLSLKLRDGYFIVGVGWILASLIGCIPYLLSGYTDSFCSAFFESAAGFTTTGATVLNVDIMPKSILMWKALCHWLGGMGILVFTISLLPILGAGGQKIFKAEAPGLRLDKVSSRISDSAKVLYLMYIGFTVIEFLLLTFSDMSTFDAMINTLGCISTGGLFSHSSGIAYFDSFYVEMVISIFTLLASVNFTLYSFAVKGKFRQVFKDAELRVFLLIILIATVIISIYLYFSGAYDSFSQSLRYAFFQVTAFSSTSGYTFAEYTLWPTFCTALLVILMLIGGCAASTCGSIKVIRIMVMLKLILRGMYRRIHPRAVVAVKIGGQPVPADIVSQITTFIFTFLFIVMGGAVILSLQGFDMITNLSASLSMLSNTGISFGQVGASGNFGMFAPPLQLFLSLLMILGRLEIFTLLLLFAPSFWRHDKAVY